MPTAMVRHSNGSNNIVSIFPNDISRILLPMLELVKQRAEETRAFQFLVVSCFRLSWFASSMTTGTTGFPLSR